MVTLTEMFHPERDLGPAARDLIRTATVVLDTNCLLELYRLSSSSRGQALDALDAVRTQLWMPNQVGIEFFRNLPAVRDQLLKAYEQCVVELQKVRKPAIAGFGAKDSFQQSRKAVTAAIDEALELLIGTINALRDGDESVVRGDCDKILARLEYLFEGRVGEPPSVEALEARVRRFETYRAPNRIPPGYDDAGKGTPISAAGDYLLWCEVLDYAESKSSDVLLVTNDEKSDWSVRVPGMGAAPRPELAREFATRTGKAYQQINLAQFMKLASSELSVTVGLEAIEEIETLAVDASADALSIVSSWLVRDPWMVMQIEKNEIDQFLKSTTFAAKIEQGLFDSEVQRVDHELLFSSDFQESVASAAYYLVRDSGARR